MWQAAEPLDPSIWIPLSQLAIEGIGKGDTIEARAAHLRRDLADEVLADDIGRPCVPRSVARQLFTARAERQARAAERVLPVDSDIPAIRRRLRALRERHQTGNPLGDMKQGDYEAQWDKAADLRAELTRSDRTGQMQYHPIRNENNDG